MFNKHLMNDTVKSVVEAIVLSYYEQKYDFGETMHDSFVMFVKSFNVTVLARSFEYWTNEYHRCFKGNPFDLFESLDYDLYDEAHSAVDDDELNYDLCEYLRVMAEEIVVDPLKKVELEQGQFSYIDCLIKFIDLNGYSIQVESSYGTKAGEEARAYEEKYKNLLRGLVQD